MSRQVYDAAREAYSDDLMSKLVSYQYGSHNDPLHGLVIINDLLLGHSLLLDGYNKRQLEFRDLNFKRYQVDTNESLNCLEVKVKNDGTKSPSSSNEDGSEDHNNMKNQSTTKSSSFNGKLKPIQYLNGAPDMSKTLEKETVHCIRNKNINLCVIAAIGLLLFYRFDNLTGDLRLLPLPKFNSFELWNKLKLLFKDAQRSTTPISRGSEIYLISLAFSQAGIQPPIGLGGDLGRKGNMKNLSKAGIKSRIPNNNSISNDLPEKEFVKKVAGFEKDEPVKLNRDIEPPAKLMTKVFPWLERVISEYQSYASDVGRNGSDFYHFLQFLKELRKVILQDLAVIINLHDDSIFKDMKLLNDKEFIEYLKVVFEGYKKDQQRSIDALSGPIVPPVTVVPLNVPGPGVPSGVSSGVISGVTAPVTVTGSTTGPKAPSASKSIPRERQLSFSSGKPLHIEILTSDDSPEFRSPEVTKSRPSAGQIIIETIPKSDTPSKKVKKTKPKKSKKSKDKPDFNIIQDDYSPPLPQQVLPPAMTSPAITSPAMTSPAASSPVMNLLQYMNPQMQQYAAANQMGYYAPRYYQSPFNLNGWQMQVNNLNQKYTQSLENNKVLEERIKSLEGLNEKLNEKVESIDEKASIKLLKDQNKALKQLVESLVDSKSDVSLKGEVRNLLDTITADFGIKKPKVAEPEVSKSKSGPKTNTSKTSTSIETEPRPQTEGNGGTEYVVVENIDAEKDGEVTGSEDEEMESAADEDYVEEIDSEDEPLPSDDDMRDDTPESPEEIFDETLVDEDNKENEYQSKKKSKTLKRGGEVIELVTPKRKHLSPSPAAPNNDGLLIHRTRRKNSVSDMTETVKPPPQGPILSVISGKGHSPIIVPPAISQIPEDSPVVHEYILYNFRNHEKWGIINYLVRLKNPHPKKKKKFIVVDESEKVRSKHTQSPPKDSPPKDSSSKDSPPKSSPSKNSPSKSASKKSPKKFTTTPKINRIVESPQKSSKTPEVDDPVDPVGTDTTEPSDIMELYKEWFLGSGDQLSVVEKDQRFGTRWLVGNSKSYYYRRKNVAQLLVHLRKNSKLEALHLQKLEDIVQYVEIFRNSKKLSVIEFNALCHKDKVTKVANDVEIYLKRKKIL